MDQCVWEVINVSEILVGKCERKETVSRPRGKWVIDVKMELTH
jgi:hypothetical protein